MEAALKGPEAALETTLRGREAALETYRRFRKISNHHAGQALKRVPKALMLERAKRLGLLSKQKVLVAGSQEELTLVFDLAIYSKRMARATVIEMYRRSCDPERGSGEERVLEAMCDTRFKLLAVVRRHPEAGLVVRDLFTQEELWLMDESLEQSSQEDTAFAARVFQPGEFWMTTGGLVPLIPALILELVRDFPSPVQDKSLREGRNARFIEAVYKTAIAGGAMDRVAFG